ncbi:hypothetical protein E4U12_004231 [Claviceps purpurea]|nr:hypothetical protein E4U12_004231 [Claviceps purpurea]KAG6191962.1 hypothetical protein E4U27_003963 [Claviceps purpurea]KAG6300816.1 hypothetical protein E4U45_003671 [Claviceps purpurea]
MIEPAWAHLKRETTKKGAPKNRQEAVAAWKAAWEELSQEKIRAWIERATHYGVLNRRMYHRHLPHVPLQDYRPAQTMRYGFTNYGDNSRELLTCFRRVDTRLLAEAAHTGKYHGPCRMRTHENLVASAGL